MIKHQHYHKYSNCNRKRWVRSKIFYKCMHLTNPATWYNKNVRKGANPQKAWKSSKLRSLCEQIDELNEISKYIKIAM